MKFAKSPAWLTCVRRAKGNFGMTGWGDYLPSYILHSIHTFDLNFCDLDNEEMYIAKSSIIKVSLQFGTQRLSNWALQWCKFLLLPTQPVADWQAQKVLLIPRARKWRDLLWAMANFEPCELRKEQKRTAELNSISFSAKGQTCSLKPYFFALWLTCVC